jgi:hypothetical protein
MLNVVGQLNVIAMPVSHHDDIDLFETHTV